MKRLALVPQTLFLLLAAPATFAAAARFEKVTEHVYWLQLTAEGPICTAVVTENSVLLVNPPPQPELGDVFAALRRVTSKPVNWVVNTDYSHERTGGGRELVKQGAAILESKELRRLASSVLRNEPQAAPAAAKEKTAGPGARKTDEAERLIFGHQVRLFPDNLEVRIFSLQFKAHTAGDVVVYIPAEKVLIVGDLFMSGSYPDINREGGEGSVLGWLDGMRQVIETVPLLKSAMPQPKPDPARPLPEEKTLEELVVVVPGRGVRTNLQEMKSLLESSQKLRNEISRAVSAGRNRDTFMASQSLNAYRTFDNLDSFAGQLFDELAARKTK